MPRSYKTLFDRVKAVPQLRRAWRLVYKNAMGRDTSETTKADAEEFALNAEPSLDRISRALRKGKFKFASQRGVPIEKSSGKYRGLVVAPVASRIVQRSILDVFQSLPAVRTRLDAGLNFGGVPRGNTDDAVAVPGAIKRAHELSCRYSHFARTDIVSFFDNVPRDRAVDTVLVYSDGSSFDELLRDATITELDNLESLDRHLHIFPLEGIGLAQGSCLSPMLCNLYLDEFDKQMNDRGVECVRYIDDFVIFTSGQRRLGKALEGARRYLATLGLDAYDPRQNPKKAEQGLTSTGFEFLGCEVAPGRVAPSSDNQRKLLEKVRIACDAGLRGISDPLSAIRGRHTLPHTLIRIGDIIRGWGNTFSFCTDDGVMHGLDQRIDHQLEEFLASYRPLIKRASSDTKRRLLGVWRLKDCNLDVGFVLGSESTKGKRKGRVL